MSEYPVICIDQNKYCIRIHKSTLHMLRNPKFIQLLINPEKLNILIRAANRSDQMTHRIRRENFVSKQSYELTCKQLILDMRSLCVNWDTGESFRIVGEIIPLANIARFDLCNILRCSND